MTRRVLITGGAGFIGSHLADELLALGHRVRVLDSLEEQVHGEKGRRPDYLAPDIELQVGDVRDPDAVARALEGVDEVVHLAARVGVGQSMYQVGDYTGVNDHGTAVLLQALIERPVERLLVASSMSIYGEGLYLDEQGRAVDVSSRSVEQQKAGLWEPVSPTGGPLTPVPTPETHRPGLASVYALNKYVQERLCLIIGEAYNIPTVAMRFFNCFGTRQALSNPYTGVLAIFASRLLNGKAPMIFEDGMQRRDFVHVDDVVQACRLGLTHANAPGKVFNVSSGVSRTVRDVAQKLAVSVGRPDIEPEVTGTCRIGDIRHCFADITLARETLGFEPKVPLEVGLAELAEWLSRQVAVDRVDQMRTELARRGLSA
ncbi:NAD-dependent epimerase/dehydratase family protein [Azospirillum sp. SYSU D00513]|uniref:NAD-dependent epimerase/dehydratase family protein n=1 Tax=Azospirillum sp. SYSU D00513 TaxID=2812561 RepID=UPI001A97AE59|nr:NAD-dependent epimerase/dehydratase family protein [Azospirillum sp. SYSU D00513]